MIVGFDGMRTGLVPAIRMGAVAVKIAAVNLAGWGNKSRNMVSVSRRWTRDRSLAAVKIRTQPLSHPNVKIVWGKEAPFNP